jgi:DNA-binding MarR family transcriptional regulator
MSKIDLIKESNYPIKSKVIALMYLISNEFENNNTTILKKYKLSKTQLDILHELEISSDQELTVNEIRSQMRSSSPNVSRSLNALVKEGLVIKERDENDQRVVHIKITKEGLIRHKDASASIVENAIDINLSSEELADLYHLLIKFNKVI